MIGYLTSKVLYNVSDLIDIKKPHIAEETPLQLLFHPLRHVPGPTLWKLSSLVRHAYNVAGCMDIKLDEFHERYGHIVRHGPNEVSFSCDTAWSNIYGKVSYKGDSRTFQLPKITSRGRDGTESIINADDAGHASMRRLMAPGFNENGIRNRGEIFDRHLDKLSDGLETIAKSNSIIDLGSWLDEWDSDFLEEFAFSSDKHRNASRVEVDTVYKWHYQTPFLRFQEEFPILGLLAGALRPNAWKTCREELINHAKDLVIQRISSRDSVQQDDLLSLIVGSSSRPRPIPEAVGNTAIMIIAGSDASSTVITGTLYWLYRAPHALRRVQAELQDAFGSERDITLETAAAKTPYLMACLEEGLRLYTPSPGVFYREVPKGPPVNIAGVEVPEKVSYSYLLIDHPGICSLRTDKSRHLSTGSFP